MLALLLLPLLAAPPCTSCAAWNATQPPFRLYGNSYYVGVRGLSAVLVTSSEGHVLIDGDLPESAEKIAASIRALGFRVEDVKLILNSHVHFDHAGGIAALQRQSHAAVAAGKRGAEVLRQGHSDADDPQFGELPPFAPVPGARGLDDGETLRVGPIAITAHATPGHTPGGMSFTWTSCEAKQCRHVVYADSLTPVSAEGYKFTAHPDVLAAFEKSFAAVEALPCEVLVTTHPDEALLDKQAGVVDARACKELVERSRERLRKRLADERAK